jgi:Flp pilus assembly protein TadD
MSEVGALSAGVLKRCQVALAGLVAALTVAACAQGPGAALLANNSATPAGPIASASEPDRSELKKATEYWGKAYAANPSDAQSALNYAMNLKASGEKQRALAVLQQASAAHGAHRGINSEYGRLALEFDQVGLAEKLLERADDPSNPDWRVISARGTVLAKQGKYREAIALYERALTIAPNQASVLSNLALAQAMDGNASKAEVLLKKATLTEAQDPRINQNLALVLGLQGKYDEAKLAAAHGLPADQAASNVEYLQRIVQAEPKPLSTAAIAQTQAKAAIRSPGATGGKSAEEQAGWTMKVVQASGK